MRIINGKDFYDHANPSYSKDVASKMFIRKPFLIDSIFDTKIITTGRYDPSIYLSYVAVAGKVIPYGYTKYNSTREIKASRNYPINYTNDFGIPYTIKVATSFYNIEQADFIKELFDNYHTDFLAIKRRTIKYAIEQHFDQEINASNFLIDNGIVTGISNAAEEGDYIAIYGYADSYRRMPMQEKMLCNSDTLGTIEFYKYQDAYTTYQQIEQFVDGVLVDNKNIVNISDKSKIVKAGFDFKTSFRKRKNG